METSREIAIANAKLVLKQAGFFVDNLWHVDDVKDRFECDDDMAQSILWNALTNEYITEKIYNEVIDVAQCEGLTLREDW